jgi:hypothetical protein
MSVSNYIASIRASRDKIHDKLVSMELAQSGDKLAKLANTIEGIPYNKELKGSVQEGGTYAIPQGYHDGKGYVQGVGGGGNYELMPPQEVEPTKSGFTVDKGDYYGLSGVTVKPIPDIYQDVSDVNVLPGEVLSGKIYVDSDGTPTPGEMDNNGTVNKTLDTTTTEWPIAKGYHSGEGKMRIVLETKTNVEPQRDIVAVEPTPGKVLSKVTIAPIPTNLQDVTPVTAEGQYVLEDYTIVDSSGTPVDGTMPNKGAINGSIDGLITTSYTVPAGYHNGNGTVSLTNDIENALAAI